MSEKLDKIARPNYILSTRDMLKKNAKSTMKDFFNSPLSVNDKS